jgi:N-acetylglucosaminyl-diphospho-decaprenol L-rhamnosyltransferase
VPRGHAAAGGALSAPARPEVSIVVVSWQARDHVLRCLASLERHVMLPFRAIVVDDGSADGTAEAVGERFPQAVLVAKPHNEGLVAGRNDALPHIRGRVVLMLDADTEVRPGAVEALVRALEEHPGAGLVGPKLFGADGELQLSCRRWPPFSAPFTRRGPLAVLNPEPRSHRRHLMEDFDHATARPVVWVAGAAQAWRADLPSRIGRYDRHVSSYGGEDLDWCLRVWKAGLEVWYVPEAVVMHHWQKLTRQSMFGRRAWRALRDWYYLQWKHRALRRDPRLDRANA